MFLTTRQLKALNAQKPRARNQGVPHQRLGISESGLHSINSDIFKNFIEALEVMSDPDYFHTFEGRFKKHHDNIWELTRQIRTQMKQLRS